MHKWLAVSSYGERLPLNRWDEWPCGRFDVIEAFGVWDEDHWAAFWSWAKAPFTL